MSRKRVDRTNYHRGARRQPVAWLISRAFHGSRYNEESLVHHKQVLAAYDAEMERLTRDRGVMPTVMTKLTCETVCLLYRGVDATPLFTREQLG